MKKSNLPQDILKKIWSISSQNTKGCLIKENFFIALRLIALAQNGFPFSRQEIEMNEPIPPLPIFISLNKNDRKEENNNQNKDNEGEDDDDDETLYMIPETNIILYKKYFENNKDSNDNFISTKKAIEIWKRNTTSDFTIKKVANSLKPLEKNGFLNLREFQVANHLLSICNCHEIPVPLPNCLLQFLGRPLNKNNIKKKKKIKHNNFHNFNDLTDSNNQQELDFNNTEQFNKEFNYEYFNNENMRQIPLQNKDNISNINELDDKNLNELDNDKIIYNKSNNSFIEEEINNKNVEDKKEHNFCLENSIDKNIVSNTSGEKDDKKDKAIESNDLKLREITCSQNTLNTYQNETKNNINNKNLNDIILQQIIKKLEELETKNNNNNNKISLLLSQINNLRKDQQTINKEITQLKEEFQRIKNQNKSDIIIKEEELINKNNIITTNKNLNQIFIENNKEGKINLFYEGDEPNKNDNQTIPYNFQRIRYNNKMKRDEKSEVIKTSQKNKSKIDSKIKTNFENQNNQFLPKDTEESSFNLKRKNKCYKK